MADPLEVDGCLIVGAGLAGLYLALKMAPRPCLVIAPHGPGESASSTWAQGGIAAALAPGDTPQAHVDDTIRVGAGLVDRRAAQAICAGGPALVEDLARLGAPFDRDHHGGYALSREAAHSAPRVARVKGDGAGRAIMSAVARAAVAAEHIRLRAGLTAVSLLRRDNGDVGGCLARMADGTLLPIHAHEVILAAGGVGALFGVTTNPAAADGSAIALAARVGVPICDSEFVQFHPTALDFGVDPAPLATEALRGDGAVVVDAAGCPLTDPLGPRDVVARAVHSAKMSGRGAFLDARGAIGAAFPHRFPAVFAACQAAGLDPRTDMMPIAPAAHYHMGGVVTDLDGRTSVAGLWAVGEAGRTGMHGANRLASNSLLEAGVIAARAAAVLRDGTKPRGKLATHAPPPPPVLSASQRHDLRAAMSTHLSVVRDEAGLATLQRAVLTMASPADGQKPKQNPGQKPETNLGQNLGQNEDQAPEHSRWPPLELPNPVLTALIMCTAARARRASCGAHWRSDAHGQTAAHPGAVISATGGHGPADETAPLPQQTGPQGTNDGAGPPPSAGNDAGLGMGLGMGMGAGMGAGHSTALTWRQGTPRDKVPHDSPPHAPSQTDHNPIDMTLIDITSYTNDQSWDDRA